MWTPTAKEFPHQRIIYIEKSLKGDKQWKEKKVMKAWKWRCSM